MPILNKLEYLDETKQQIKNALNTKFNSQITDEDTFRSYVDKIKNIYTNWPKVTGEGTNITLNNTKKGRLGLEPNGDLSQETTTGKNLLPYNQLITTTVNGITFTPVFEGSNLLYVKASGLASANTTYRFYGIDTITPQKVFDSATKISFGLTGSSSTYGMVVWGLNSGGVNIGAEIYDETEYATGFQLAGIGLRVHSGANVDIKFYPMVRLSTITDDTYEPFTNNQPSPSPDYPQEIKVATGNQNVKIQNKNLISIDMVNGTDAGITFINNEKKTFSIEGTSTAGVPRTIKANFKLTAGTYTISVEEPLPAGVYISLDNVPTTMLNPTTASRTFTISKDTVYNRCLLWIDANKTVDYTGKLQIEPNHTKTDFEPHQEQTYPLSLGSLELAKIVNYKDYIYRENAKWYKYGAIKKVVLNGGFISAGTNVPSVFYTNGIIDYARSNNIPYSNYYNGISNVGGASSMSSQNNNTIAFINASGLTTPRFYIRDTRYESTDAVSLNNWLSSNPLIVYYVLETPTITEITDTTLIEQLDNLYNANSYDDTTVIFSDGDLPIVMNASALMKGGA